MSGARTRKRAPVSVPATVASRQDSRVAAEAAGRITFVVEPGDMVEEGQPLASIDDAEASLALEAAEARARRLEVSLGRLSRDVEKARLDVEKARNGLTEIRRLVGRGIIEHHAAVVLARKHYAAAVKAVRAGEENLRVTNLKYREGLVTNTDVIDALLSLSRSRFDRVQALKNFHINRYGLMRLAGTIEEIL